MNRIDLAGRGAVVTGGAQGIGYAIAQRLLASGASVTLWDIDQPLLDSALESLASYGKVEGRCVELTDEAAVAAASEAAMGWHGRIDILVNNAGITGGNAPTWELAPEIWRRVIEVNLIAPYLTCRALVPYMIDRGYGRIVNIASVAGKEGNPKRVALQRVEGGADRVDEVARQGTRDDRRAGQRGVARGREDGAVRHDDRGPHRLHAVEDPDGPLPRSRRGGCDGGVARVAGVFVHDRCGVRSVGRPRDVLIGVIGRCRRCPSVTVPMVSDEAIRRWVDARRGRNYVRRHPKIATSLAEQLRVIRHCRTLRECEPLPRLPSFNVTPRTSGKTPNVSASSASSLRILRRVI
jgi:NAD(P)-dependent dehydrogenase (short-subunit alcohol dehydrogenase family)